jgi:5-methyltetrahydropteroyltriglutamate--homocysteine methyltransferase
MKRSDRRGITSLVGSLPRPDALIELNRTRFAGDAYDASAYAASLSAAAKEVCRRHPEIGIDVINDGTDCGLGGRIHPRLA